MRKQKGFSLIELLIVVAIILIIAAIAIPNLLRSRMAANEASAVGTLRTINTAEVTYNSTYPDKGFSDDLATLGSGGTDCKAPTVTGACLVDDVIAKADTTAKSGYKMTYAKDAGGGSTNVTYTVLNDPSVAGQTGQRHFCTDQSGVIRNDPTTAITGDGKACPTTAAPLQ